MSGLELQGPEEQRLVPGVAGLRPARVHDAVGGALYAAVAALGLGAVFLRLSTATWLSVAVFALTLAVVHLTTNRSRTPGAPEAPTPWRRTDGRDLGVLLTVVGVTALLARAGDRPEATAGFVAWLVGLVALGAVRLVGAAVVRLRTRERAETCLQLLEEELRAVHAGSAGRDEPSIEVRRQEHLVRQARDLLSQELRLLEARQVPVADVERVRRQGVEVLRRMPRRVVRVSGAAGGDGGSAAR